MNPRFNTLHTRSPYYRLFSPKYILKKKLSCFDIFAKVAKEQSKSWNPVTTCTSTGPCVGDTVGAILLWGLSVCNHVNYTKHGYEQHKKTATRDGKGQTPQGFFSDRNQQILEKIRKGCKHKSQHLNLRHEYRTSVLGPNMLLVLWIFLCCNWELPVLLQRHVSSQGN